MSVYVIASYDVVDAKKYEGYLPGVLPLLQKHGAEILVADFEAQQLEGEKRSVHVVLRFQSEAAALGWYNDPAYAGVRKIVWIPAPTTTWFLPGSLFRRRPEVLIQRRR